VLLLLEQHHLLMMSGSSGRGKLDMQWLRKGLLRLLLHLHLQLHLLLVRIGGAHRNLSS
jgi:hypothetical protein